MSVRELTTLRPSKLLRSNAWILVSVVAGTGEGVLVASQSAGWSFLAAALPLFALSLVWLLQPGRGFFAILALLVVFIACTIDTLRLVSLGSISGLGIASVVILLLAALSLLRSGIGRATGVAPLLGFLAWTATSFFWFPPGVAGVQNLVVLMMFGLLVAAAASASASDVVVTSALLTKGGVFVAIAYLLLSLGAGIGAVGLFGPRSFALFALVALAPVLAQARYRSTSYALLALLPILTIGLSLSRTALVVALIMVVLSRWSPDLRPRVWLRLLAVSIIGAFALLYVIGHVTPLRDRFEQGDVREVTGGLRLNTSGRYEMWRVTWDSFRLSPLIGRGTGSANELLGSTLGVAHPHNDYLRVLHDNGIIGLTLLLTFFGLLMRRIVRNWRSADRSGSPTASLHLTAFLGLVALLSTMLTDNPLSYAFVLGPLGLLFGGSLALSESLVSPASPFSTDG